LSAICTEILSRGRIDKRENRLYIGYGVVRGSVSLFFGKGFFFLIFPPVQKIMKKTNNFLFMQQLPFQDTLIYNTPAYPFREEQI